MENAFKRKQQICGIGQRLYNKGFAAANDGNITYRLHVWIRRSVNNQLMPAFTLIEETQVVI